MKLIDINVENIGINTEYCFDSNGSDEFKCECNEGFDGKRCEDECSLKCGDNASCATEINSITGIKQSKCVCADNFTGFHSQFFPVETNFNFSNLGPDCNIACSITCNLCDENPCHNGGTCRAIFEAGIQVCFMIYKS